MPAVPATKSAVGPTVRFRYVSSVSLVVGRTEKGTGLCVRRSTRTIHQPKFLYTLTGVGSMADDPLTIAIITATTAATAAGIKRRSHILGVRNKLIVRPRLSSVDTWRVGGLAGK